MQLLQQILHFHFGGLPQLRVLVLLRILVGRVLGVQLLLAARLHIQLPSLLVRESARHVLFGRRHSVLVLILLVDLLRFIVAAGVLFGQLKLLLLSLVQDVFQHGLELLFLLILLSNFVSHNFALLHYLLVSGQSAVHFLLPLPELPILLLKPGHLVVNALVFAFHHRHHLLNVLFRYASFHWAGSVLEFVNDPLGMMLQRVGTLIVGRNEPIEVAGGFFVLMLQE